MICEELKYSDTFVTKNLFLSSNKVQNQVVTRLTFFTMFFTRICENIDSIIKFLFGGLKNLLNIFNATTSWELIEN